MAAGGYTATPDMGIDGDCFVDTPSGNVRVRELRPGDLLMNAEKKPVVLENIMRVPSDGGLQKLCNVDGILLVPDQQVFARNIWHSASHLVTPIVRASRSTYVFSVVGSDNILANGVQIKVLAPSACVGRDSAPTSRL